MHIEIKNHLEAIKEEHNKLLKIAQDNCNIPFFNEIAEKLSEINIDVRETFGEYLYKCIYPISYKTISNPNQSGSSHRGMPAVGKWFGSIRHCNISYYGKNIWGDLQPEHIHLIPDTKKQKIVQDFYDFKKTIEGFNLANKYPFNVSGNLHMTDKLQTSKYVYYIILKDELPIEISAVELMVQLQPYQISFTMISNGPSCHKESYTISKQNKAVTSTALKRITESSYSPEYICFDSPSICLTDEIKSAMLGLVNKGKELQENWIKLKTKYAYLLLNKGNI
jgi:hypothetical protein